MTKLCENSLIMDAKELWQRYQDWLYYHEGLGLYLDISSYFSGFSLCFAWTYRTDSSDFCNKFASVIC
ncbi:hypothetical protein FLX35_08600 [Cylindrospermopsis raciborskii LB2897]|nr:hypothetical protein [Cylindrospermopsis raciborskii LB2897]